MPSSAAKEAAAAKAREASELRSVEYRHLSAVIDDCARRSDVAGAEKAFQQMQAKGFERSAVGYNRILHAYARVGDVEKAERCLSQMIESNIELQTVTFNTIIDACSKAEEFSLTYGEPSDLSEGGKLLRPLGVSALKTSLIRKHPHLALAELAVQVRVQGAEHGVHQPGAAAGGRCLHTGRNPGSPNLLGEVLQHSA